MQEAYRPLRGKHTLCYPRWGVPTLVGGTYSGGEYLPWWGVPTLVGGTYPRWGGYLPWWGVPTLVGGGTCPRQGGTYPR